LICCVVFEIPVCQSAESVPRVGKSIAIAAVGNPDSSMVTSTASWIRRSCRCDVNVKSPVSAVQSSPKGELEYLAGQLKQDDVFLVALVDVPEDVTFRKGIFKSNNVALLNVWALRPARILETQSLRDQYAGRVLKEAMYAVGALLGLGECPNPQCVMSTWENDAQLDAKGGNFCPPCDAKAEKLFKALGVHRLE